MLNLSVHPAPHYASKKDYANLFCPKIANTTASVSTTTTSVVISKLHDEVCKAAVMGEEVPVLA